MATSATVMSGRELMRKLMAGERDVSGTRIPQDKGRLTEDRAEFESFNAYLRGQDLRASPISAEGVDWRGLQAPGVFLLATRFPRADLRGANLAGADVRRSDLTAAQLQGANLNGASLTHCVLRGADLSDAFMRGVDLYEASVTGAVLRRADLAGALLFRLNFKDADLTDATVFGAQFYRSDLRGALGIETLRDLSTARHHHTAVTERELRLIESAFRAGPLFDIQPE